jgi:hypothetical protein
MLAVAHEHTGKQIGIETQMKQRHNFPNVCAHSLRVNFMVIGAATLNLFTPRSSATFCCCCCVLEQPM